MTKARFGLALSWLALVVALVAVGASTLPDGGRYMGGFMIDHGLVILNVMFASWTLRRRRPDAPPFRWPGARRLFAPWLLATGGLVAIALIVLPVLLPIDLLLPLGQHLQLVSHSMIPTPHATGRAQDADQAFAMFAHAWVVFSFAGLCMWHLVALREAQAREPAGAIETARHPDYGVDPEGRLAFRRRVLIIAIWTLALAWSLVALFIVPFVGRQLCAAPFPWPFVLMPAVVFALSGLFAKRTQYLSPWLCELVDSRFGAGAYVRFLVGLKPMLMFAACSVLAGLAALKACDGLTFMSLFFASGGLGFALMHFVMRARRIEGV
jgi:hypothetical protein